MEFNHGNGSNKHLDQNPEVKHEDGKPLLDANSLDFFSPHYASSSFISSHESKAAAIDGSSAKPELDLNFLSGSEFASFPDNTTQTTPAENGLQPFQEMPTVSPDGGVSSMDSQMKSPPVQTMGRPSDYDPNRIPASIFSSKPSNPQEWSVTSNESLFSIHMGNNSFSRDHAILFGKSGEFPKFDQDWNIPPPSAPNGAESKTNELSSLPPVMEVSAHEESSVKAGKVSRIEEEDFHKNENHVKENVAPAEIVPAAAAAATNVTDVKGPPTAETNLNSSRKHKPSYSNPRLSEESGHSGSSFAFPVLVNDAGKAGSMKAAAATEKPETPKSPQVVYEETPKTTPKATPKVADARWFSCFPWRPRCC